MMFLIYLMMKMNKKKRSLDWGSGCLNKYRKAGNLYWRYSYYLEEHGGVKHIHLCPCNSAAYNFIDLVQRRISQGVNVYIILAEIRFNKVNRGKR